LPHRIGLTGSAALVLAASLAPATAFALFNDTVEVYASATYNYDSNVFRISDKLDSASVIGTGQRHDTFFTTALGVNVDIPVSLQRFQLLAGWYDARYRTFEDLDHRGHSIRGAWLWAITPRLTGEISYNHNQALASFANIQGRRPDLVTTQMALANGAWMVTPSWRAHAETTAARTEHSDLRAVNNIEYASLEGGLSYVTPQENRVGLAVRAEKGRSPNELFAQGITFRNEYDQLSVGVQGRWVVTGHSRFDGRVHYTKREYEEFTNRNYSGPTFGVTYTWTPTGKFTVATILARDVAPLEELQSTFVLVTGVTVRPDWAISDKLNLRGTLAYAVWDYRGDTTLGLNFEHRVRTAGLELVWRPALRVAVTGAVNHERRTSTLPNADYDVNTATIGARIGF
jgi:exopolysaccharide biosynthesis operon protein EpsL